MNDTHFIRVIYSFASFQNDWMWCLCLAPIIYDCFCAVILVSSVVLRMSLLFLFWTRRLPSLERSRIEHTYTHTHTQQWDNRECILKLTIIYVISNTVQYSICDDWLSALRLITVLVLWMLIEKIVKQICFAKPY